MVFFIVGGVIVIAIAFVALGLAVGRLENERPPAVYQLDEAVDWIADRLPDEVSARLSYADVQNVVRWHLDWFTDVGVSGEFGQEIGGESTRPGDEPVIAADDAAVDVVVARSLAENGPEPVDVVCILDLQNRYLTAIGGVGPEAHENE